jgi:hypothetical protein
MDNNSLLINNDDIINTQRTKGKKIRKMSVKMVK